MNVSIARFLLKLSRPLDLLGGVLLYALGVGMARYLGSPIDWVVVTLGQAWVTTYQLGFHYLNAYFLHPTTPRDRTRITIPTDNENGKIEMRRDLLMYAAFASLAAATSLTLVLMQKEGINGSIFILQGLFLIGAIFYCVPPLRLVNSGYGELVRSIIMANLVPAFAFILQHEELHRLVGMTTFPLTMIHLEMLLAIQLPDYYQNLKMGVQTLLVRLGWEPPGASARKGSALRDGGSRVKEVPSDGGNCCDGGARSNSWS